jgi:hypothetical protein
MVAHSAGTRGRENIKEPLQFNLTIFYHTAGESS